jgi:hypothetical protein
VPVVIIPGDDPAHATSGAHYLRELLPKAEFWPVTPPEQMPERILEFGRARVSRLPPKRRTCPRSRTNPRVPAE